MFKYATTFSAILAFIIFSIAGTKYLNYMKAESQGSSNAVTSSQ